MKICAITMVYRDYWALSQWYAHYGRHLGEDNLFIVAHGADPMVQQLCPRASVITLPRDTLSGFDRVRGQMLNSLQKALGLAYEWVIRTDADELICIDPAKYQSFRDLLTEQSASALFALGFNLVELDGEAELDSSQPALKARSNAIFSGHYSKAWAVSGKASLDRHGVRVRPGLVAGFEFALPSGVFLAHLKYANRAVLKSANADRIAATQSGGRGLPGKAWQQAEQEAVSYLAKAAAMPLLDWSTSEAKALAKLQNPVRKTKDGLINTRSLRFNFRTVLPDWFKTC